MALFIPLIQNVGITILQARNQMRFRSLLYIVIAVVSLFFQIVLAKNYGALGCAIAIGGALLLGQGLIMNVYYYKCQNINIILFWKEIIKMTFVPIIITVPFIFVRDYYNMATFSHLFIAIMVFTILFVPLFWKFSMNDYERDLLLRPLKKAKMKFNHTLFR